MFKKVFNLLKILRKLSVSGAVETLDKFKPVPGFFKFIIVLVCSFFFVLAFFSRAVRLVLRGGDIRVQLEPLLRPVPPGPGQEEALPVPRPRQVSVGQVASAQRCGRHRPGPRRRDGQLRPGIRHRLHQVLRRRRRRRRRPPPVEQLERPLLKKAFGFSFAFCFIHTGGREKRR